MELQLRVERLQQRRVGRLRFHGFQREGDRHIGRNGSQPLALPHLFGVVLEALAVSLALHFRGVLQRPFRRSESLDEVLRALLPDPRRARNVVHRVAFQRQQIRHLLRPHPQEFLDLLRVVPGVVFGRIEHGDPLGDELHHVLIAGDDHHLKTRLFRAPRQRADDVIGFEPRVFQHRNLHGLQHPADVGNLLQQVRRRFLAVGLVGGELLLAQGRPFTLEDRRDVGRLILPRQLPQHAIENVDRFGGKPRAGAHGRSAAAGAGVVGAKDKPERVNQEQSVGHALACHCLHFRHNPLANRGFLTTQ